MQLQRICMQLVKAWFELLKVWLEQLRSLDVGADLVAPDLIAFFSFSISQILSMVLGGRIVFISSV